MPVENGRLEIGDYELLWMKTIEVLSILSDEIRLVRRLYKNVTGRRAKTKFPKEIRVYLRQYYSKEIQTEVVVDRIRSRLEHQSLGWKACRLNLTKTFTPIGLELTDRIYWRIRELGMIERRRSYSLVKVALWKYRKRMSVLFPDVLFRNRFIYRILDNLVSAWQKPSRPWHPVLFDKFRDTVNSNSSDDSEEPFIPDTSEDFQDML